MNTVIIIFILIALIFLVIFRIHQLITEDLRLKSVLLDISSDSIFLHDLNGKLIYVNEAAYKSRGYTKDELLNISVPALDVSNPEKLVGNLRKEGIGFYASVHYRKDGSKIPIEVYSKLIQLNGRKYILSSVRDVSERKKLDFAKEEFIGSVSHEIRTPLSIIKEGVSQILDGLQGDLDEGNKHVLNIVYKSVQRIADVINNIVSIAAIESGQTKLDLDFFDIVSLLNEVEKHFVAKIYNKGIELKNNIADGPIKIRADREKIAVVISNFIDNAIKFTELGFIGVVLTDKTDAIEISISDSGRGMENEDMDNLFNKFVQFKRLIGPGGKGTGLGLVISKALIELHGGKIKVDSQANKGSTFTFSIPK